jgi:type IV secretion system protein VirD4
VKIDAKKIIIQALPLVIMGLFATKLGQAYRLADGADFADKLTNIVGGFSLAFGNAMPSFHPFDLMIGTVCGGIFKAFVYFKGKNAKKYRKDTEYGSARWGKPDDIKPYVDPNPDNNIILTATESLTMNSRPKNPKYARNKNVLVIGGSGSGKTRFFAKPNIMQMHSSYIITDPKGLLLLECGKMLQDNGYRIKIVNTIDFKKSMKYNPFAYIRSEKDIMKFVTALIANTRGDGKSGEEFWTKAEQLLYQALSVIYGTKRRRRSRT